MNSPYTAHRIRKRPPLRAPIPSPYAGASSPKVIYVSTKAPFLSVVKRVKKLLDLADHRALGKISLEQKSSEQAMLNALAQEKEQKQNNKGEEITLKATGRAIEKLVNLAVFFQKQDNMKIVIRTESVPVIDDIVQKDEDAEDVEADIPETQIRWMSVLEVGVRSI